MRATATAPQMCMGRIVTTIAWVIRIPFWERGLRRPASSCPRWKSHRDVLKRPPKSTILNALNQRSKCPMPLRSATPSEIDAVIDRFPEHAPLIKRLFLKDRVFRSVCEDFSVAMVTLERFKNLPDADYRTEIPEYKRVIRELEVEILSCLRKET